MNARPFWTRSNFEKKDSPKKDINLNFWASVIILVGALGLLILCIIRPWLHF
ncbi:MAG: hypothetical protein WCO12_02395 [bacterium]